jgi:hypothetical protein
MEENKGAAEMVDRKEGYYWIKLIWDDDYQVGRYWKIEDSWTVSYSLDEYSDEDLISIDEREICRS